MRGAPVARDSRQVAALALLVGIPLVMGVAVATEPRLAPPLILLSTLAVWAMVRRDLAWWDLFVFVVGGVYLLDYGFANLGVPGRVPIPVVDLVAVLLVIRAATRPEFRWPGSLPFVLASVFIGLTVVRLSVDLPRFDVLAIRDATLGVELAFLFIGYWAINEYGLERIARLLSVVFVIVIPWVALYPVKDVIAAASPTVGLSRPVPLFGNFIGVGTAIAAAFFFFALVRPFGGRSYVLAAATLPLIAIQQSRGLYLAVPAAIAIVWVLGRPRARVQARRGLAGTLAVGALLLVVFFPFAPEGRLGTVSPSFVVAQMATVFGREGPSSGTVEARKEWFDSVTSQVTRTPSTLAFGVGLGPDLASGEKSLQVANQEQAVLVRKPHNDYLEIFARYGLLGLFVFVGLLGSAFITIIRAARLAEGLAGRFLWFAVAQTTVFGLIAATQPLLAFPWGTVPMFLILGAALALVELQRRDGSSDSRIPMRLR